MSRKAIAARAGVGALIATAGFAAAAASANAATCSFSTPSDPNRLTVQMTANNVVLQSRNGLIFAGELGTLGSACASRSTVSKVVVRSANLPAFDQVVVDEGGGKWGSLPLFAQTGTGNDSMVVNGSNGPDHYAALDGLGAEIDLNGDTKADFHGSSVGTITLNGNGGDDYVGGSAFGQIGLFGLVTTHRVDLRGQAGNDTVVAGRSGRDLPDGGSNDDTVFTNNGIAGDVAAGGDGFDYVAADGGDAALGFESGGIGSVKPGAVRIGKDDTASVGVVWKHPVGWRKLRTLSLYAYADGKRVGSITIDPRSGRSSDTGGLRVVGHSPVAHEGKRVSTTLEVQVGAKLTGKKIELRMQPRDR